MILGAATALIVDWTVLPQRDVPTTGPAAPSYSVGVAPRTEGGLTLMLGGSF